MNVFAQNKIIEDTTSKPAITERGKPDGKKTEMKIGNDGGSLISSDGKVELKIPEGAISKKTTFSIEPITNIIPNGNGKAYRLEPSGIQFQKPVQLIFNYDEEEAADSMQLLMGIAMQDNTGQWYSLKKFTLDTIAKTISGNINHFSDWSKFDAIKIVPDKARLKVKKNKTLAVIGMEPEPKGTGDDELMPLSRVPKKVVWSVNGIEKGNAEVGTLFIGSTGYVGVVDNNYKAPDNVPKQNPVAVSVKLQGLTWSPNGVKFNSLRLVSNILIYDNAYEVTIVSSMDASAGSELGNVAYKDTGSFVVSVNGKDTKIIEKVNKNTDAKLDYHGKCIITPLKSGSGNVHILDASNIKLIPPTSPNANAWVEISFKHSPTILTVLQFKCPPVGKGGWTTNTNATANAMMAMVPAFPQHIKFETKEEEQTILKIGEEGGKIYVKISVKQIKDE